MSDSVSKKRKEASRVTKEEWREYTKTVWQIANVSHKEHPAVFPVEIPRRLIKLFSFVGESVLDPFAGTGTTAQAAIPLGRKAICLEQNPKYVRIIQKECAGLGQGDVDQVLTAMEADSRNMDRVDSESVELIVTSPPYWNKADYGKGKANLGAIAGYRDFLHEIAPVFAECFRVLAPGRKLCLVTANVNQHTDHGLLTFPLAADFNNVLRDAGFVMTTEIIWSKDGTGGRLGSANNQRPIFGSYPYPPNFLFKNVHEYILVFSKPPKARSRGPKVLPYEGLMNRTSAGAQETRPRRHTGRQGGGRPAGRSQ